MAIGIDLKPGSDVLPLGASRLGGSPDMPAEFPWPKDGDERSMAFFAQINLSELPRGDWPAPKSGWLYVFLGGEGWEDDDLKECRVKVIHAEGPLTSRSLPDDREMPLCMTDGDTYTMTFSGELSSSGGSLFTTAELDHYDYDYVRETFDGVPQDAVPILLRIPSLQDEKGRGWSYIWGDAHCLSIVHDPGRSAKGDFSRVRFCKS